MALSEREKKTIKNMIERQRSIQQKLDEKLRVLQSHRDAGENEIKRLEALIAD